MAYVITETPPLYGEDAKRFVERTENPEKLDKKFCDEIKEAGEALNLFLLKNVEK